MLLFPVVIFEIDGFILSIDKCKNTLCEECGVKSPVYESIILGVKRRDISTTRGKFANFILGVKRRDISTTRGEFYRLLPVQ